MKIKEEHKTGNTAMAMVWWNGENHKGDAMEFHRKSSKSSIIQRNLVI